jgi:transcriptional regulator with XRE-family HTH domain
MDWKNIIADIQRHGQLTQPQIAAECGCGQATISDLASGKTAQPRHSLGESLISMLTRVSSQAKEQQPA